MQLNRLVRTLRRHLLMALVVGAVAGLATAALSFFTAKQTYTATNTVVFTVAGLDKIADPSEASLYASTMASTYGALAQSPQVVKSVAEELDLDPAQLAAGLNVVGPRQNLVMTLTWQDADEKKATQIVEAVGQQVAKVTADYTDNVDDRPRVKVGHEETSVLPTPGTGRSVIGSLAKGAVVGMMALLGWLVLRTALDHKLRDQRDLAELTDASVIAHVRHLDDTATVAKAVRFLDLEQPATFLIAPATPQEEIGELALATARRLADARPGRVLLVDADLRAGAATSAAGIDGPGLSEVLSRQLAVDEVLHQEPDGLSILPSGTLPPTAAELLASKQWTATLKMLQQSYDQIVITGHALLDHSDSAVLASGLEGVMLAVGLNQATRGSVDEALNLLESVGTKTLGVVLSELPKR